MPENAAVALSIIDNAKKLLAKKVPKPSLPRKILLKALNTIYFEKYRLMK